MFNRQALYDLGRTIQYNITITETMWKFLIGLWVQAGKPKTKEEFFAWDQNVKSIWIGFAGIIDRCFQILAEKS